MKYKFNKRKLTEYFGFYDMRDIVENIIERIDEEDIESEEDLCNQIDYAINDELIYTVDQREVIKHYSTPIEPKNIYECLEELYEEMTMCIIWGNENE